MLKLNTVLAALLLPMIIGSVPSAQAAGKGAEEEAKEGNGNARDSYFAMRRQGPTADFDVTAARHAAAQQKINAKPAFALPAAYQHAEVWDPIGPAPMVGGQT